MSVGRPKKDEKKILDNEREQKAVQYAKMVIDEHKTVRQIASETGTSKSTVHKYLKTYIDSKSLQNKVNKAMQSNFNTKHLRGGKATKKKYAEEKRKE